MVAHSQEFLTFLPRRIEVSGAFEAIREKKKRVPIFLPKGREYNVNKSFADHALVSIFHQKCQKRMHASPPSLGRRQTKQKDREHYKIFLYNINMNIKWIFMNKTFFMFPPVPALNTKVRR